MVTGNDPCPQANPSNLPLEDIPIPISISTPPGSPRSRSGNSSHNLHIQDARTDASVGDDANSMSCEDPTREGMPSKATLRVT